MSRRIRWVLPLLVGLGFVAPGAIEASATDAGAVVSSPPVAAVHAGSVGSQRPDFTPVFVRQGVDLDEARSEKAAGGSRRFLAADHAAGRAIPRGRPATRRFEQRAVGRSSPSSAVGVRAPPPGLA